MKYDKIWNEAIIRGKEVSRELINECDGTYVGAEQTETIEVDNKKYKINIVAFWEKSMHFDCSVNGVDNDYQRFKCCNNF